MDTIAFGDIGVDVKGYTPTGLLSLFAENSLDTFINKAIFLYLDSDRTYREGLYLQSDCRGLLTEVSTVYISSGFIRYTTDIETYLLILRSALLDITVANTLVNEMYYQGLIKPRNSHETN